MISVKTWGHLAVRFLDDNAPAVLTGVAAVGACSIGYLTYRSQCSAVDKIAAEEEKRLMTTPGTPTDLSKTEIFKLVWMDYIPPVCVTLMTVGAVVGANHISAKRAAGLAAAFTVSEKAYSEYRDKVIEKFNPTKEEQVRAEIGQDRLDAKPLESTKIVVFGSGDVPCFDKPGNRYFSSTMETIKQVENEVNRDIIEHGKASLYNFYGQLDLPETPMCTEIGFTLDHPLNVRFTTDFTMDGKPCIVIDYDFVLFRDFKSFESD